MKKPIIIKEENRERIEAVLNEVQHSCSVRTICADDIFNGCLEVEEKLGITKVAMDEVVATINENHRNMPNAYHYRAESTHFKVVYKNKKWYLVDVWRDNVEIKRYRVRLTEKAKAALIERFECFNS